MSVEIIITAIVGIVLIIGVIIGLIKEKKNVMKWLFYAVTEAEKILGSKTGQLKLAQVFANFITAFPFFSKIITFNTFSKWVDIALEKMKEYLKDNENANKYVENK